MIETTEGEIQTLLHPYFKGEQKKKLLEILNKIEGDKDNQERDKDNQERDNLDENESELLSKITKRPE